MHGVGVVAPAGSRVGHRRAGAAGGQNRSGGVATVSRQRLGRSLPARPPSSLLAALASTPVLAPLGAQTCPAPPSCDRSGCYYASCATPASPVPPANWGELQPATTGCALPGDS